MPTNVKRRKRPESGQEGRKGVKKSKLAGGKAFVQKSGVNEVDSGSEGDERREEMLYSESDDERLHGVGEEGVDLSDLMDMDETPVTRPDSHRPTIEHSQMLRTLRKGLGLDYATQRAKAREEAKAIVPARKENAFSVAAEGAAKVDLSDLLASPGFSKETKKGLEKLSRSERRLVAESSKEAKARFDRSVQYEDTKQLLTEWLPTVQTMRQSDSLVFPLPEQIPKREKATTSGTTSSFTPTTDLEKTIFGILEDSGVTEAKLQQAEELATKKLSQDEINARHGQIARLRSLFFYQEQKNKRQAKIKSKKYRKLLKKDKQKHEPTLAELAELDPEAYAAELVKLDRARAEERVGIKHAHLGKWAKHALRSKDPHTMQAVRDHLEHGRRLRKKMETDHDGSDDSDDDSDVDEDGSIHDSDLESEPNADEDQEDGDIIDIHGNIVSKKKKVADDDDEDAEAGIFAMKFMQRAAAKRQADHDGLMAQMDSEIEQRKRALKQQRKQAKDDLIATQGLKADSDSDSDDAPPKSQPIDSDDEKMDAGAGELSATRKGRKSVSSSAMQVSAAALAAQSTYDSDDDNTSSMVMDHVHQGFSASVKGRMAVKPSSKVSAKPSAQISSDSENEASGGEDTGGESSEEAENGTHVFKPNTRSVAVPATTQVSSKSKKKAQAAQAKAKPAETKANGKASAARPKASELNEDAVLIGSISSGGGLKSSGKGDDESDDETVIDISQTVNQSKSNKKAAPVEENPWMVVEEDDDGLVIPGTVALSKAGSASKAAPKSSKKSKKTEDRVAVDLEAVQRKLKAEEARNETVFNLSAAGATSRAQRELIERAFAGDHLTESEIAAEKMSAVEEANEVEDEYKMLTLPGWGEWAGTHVKPSALRQKLTREMEAKKQARSEELMAARRDAKLKHAIVSDKQHSKQFAMYQARAAPSEFRDNAELYEASLRQPMGKEWNVRDSHAKLVKPKVVALPGLAIEPIQKKREGIQRPK